MSLATAPAQENQELRHVGKRTKRSDGPERLTGATLFTGDLALPGLLHARLVRSPYAAAKVISINGSEALKLPGVTHVMTAHDLPVPDVKTAIEQRRILLAYDRVLHAGAAVAVVLGETPEAAEDGVNLVEVEYEPLDAISDPEAATSFDAPVVRAKAEADEAEAAAHGMAVAKTDASAPQAPNVTGDTRNGRGDLDAAFASCDVVVEKKYTTSWVHQGYLEPQNVAAQVDPFGNLVIYSPTQALFPVRTAVARTLGVEDGQVKVQPVATGGAFGGKFALIDPTVAALATAVKRPVLLTYTRLDEFGAACPAPQSVSKVKMGARKDGTLVALDLDVLFDSGSFPASPAGMAPITCSSTYKWEAVRSRGVEVLTNKTATGAYRAPGVPQVTFAVESTVDEVAHQLGIDPFELRRKNAIDTGDLNVAGAKWPSIGLQQCIEAGEAAYRAEVAAKGPNEGVGIAIGGWPGGLEPCAAICRLNSDGSLQVLVGSADISGVGTSFQLIAAETFGLDSAAEVKVITGATDISPHAGASAGSKTMYTVGAAVQKAAEDAKQQVLKIASALMEAGLEDLEIKGGKVQVKGVPGKSVTLKEIFNKSASFGARFEPVYGRGQHATTQRAPGFSMQIARVHVDPDTGEVTPIKLVCVQDVGKAINPAAVEGQIHGGAVQGVGYGLWERLVHDEAGTPLVGSLMDYTLPKATQSPALEAIMVEVPSGVGPFGARGVGEPPIIPGAAALANAVRDACGARVTGIPITAERVFEAMSRG
jgi:CO/xanthine dehydrogenase Mo-binding subunit